MRQQRLQRRRRPRPHVRSVEAPRTSSRLASAPGPAADEACEDLLRRITEVIGPREP